MGACALRMFGYAGRLISAHGRLDDTQYYAKKQLMHHRTQKQNPLIWCGTLENVGPELSGKDIFVFEPEACKVVARTACQLEQVKCGARVKHSGVSHREFMTGSRSDATGNPLSDLLDRLQQLEQGPEEALSETASTVAEEVPAGTVPWGSQLVRLEQPVLDGLVGLAGCIQLVFPVAAGVAATTVGAETGRSNLLTS